MSRFLAFACLLLVGLGWGMPAYALDQGEAYEACLERGVVVTTGHTSPSYECRPRDPLTGYDCYRKSAQTGNVWQVCPSPFYFSFTTGCESRPLEYGWMVPDPATNPEQKVCHNGCTYKAYEDPSAGNSYFATLNEAGTGTLGVCSVSDFAAPAFDADGDGVADEDDAFPNDPNESVDSDGDGIGDNADFAPDDPTDGKDTPGEEDGDDEGDNVASGGGDCNAPPTCSGDGIQCAQLHTQWKIMCKGARLTGAPEVCESSYTCDGDAAQCAEIALLRKSACADVIVGDSAAQEILDGLKNGPSDQVGDPGSVWAPDDGTAEADDSGFGLTRSCPPPVSVYGKTISMPCDLGAVIAAIVLLAGFVQFGYAFTRN